MTDIFTLLTDVAGDVLDSALDVVAGAFAPSTKGAPKQDAPKADHVARHSTGDEVSEQDAQTRALLMRPDNIGQVTLAAVQVVSTGGIVLIMGKKRKFVAARGDDGTVGIFEFRFPLPDAPSYEVGMFCVIGRVVGEAIFPVVGQGEEQWRPLVGAVSRMHLTGLIVKNFAGIAHGNDVAEFDSLPRVYINDEACNEAGATPTTSIERPNLGEQGQKSNPRTAHGVIMDDDSDDFAEDFAGSLRRILTAAARVVGDGAKPDNSAPADNISAVSTPVFDEAGYYTSRVAHASSKEDNCLSAAGDLTDAKSVDGGKHDSHLPPKMARNTTAYDVSRMFNDRRDGVDIAYAGAVALSLGKTGIIACVVALAVADMAIANGDGDRTFTDIVPMTYSDLTELLSGAEDSVLESIAVILNDTATQRLMGMSGAQIIQNALDDIPSLIKRAEDQADSAEQEAPL